MRTTVTVDDALLAKAAELTGVKDEVDAPARGVADTGPGGERPAVGGSRRHRPASYRGAETPDVAPVILVDTSVWIEHLRAADARLVELLGDDEAGCHPLVIEELALGSIKQRDVVLDLLANLYQFPVVTHDEVLRLVGRRRLWGRGLGAVDANLLGSVALVGGARLWTRDKRLKAACAESGVALAEEVS